MPSFEGTLRVWETDKSSLGLNVNKLPPRDQPAEVVGDRGLRGPWKFRSLQVHALALPGALTRKGHRVAEGACVSPRPQTRVEGQTDNVRGRRTAFKQLGRRQVLETPGSPQNSGSHHRPLTTTLHALHISRSDAVLSLGRWVREIVSYFTQWGRSFLKERCTESEPPCASACWLARGEAPAWTRCLAGPLRWLWRVWLPACGSTVPSPRAQDPLAPAAGFPLPGRSGLGRRGSWGGNCF